MKWVWTGRRCTHCLSATPRFKSGRAGVKILTVITEGGNLCAVSAHFKRCCIYSSSNHLLYSLHSSHFTYRMRHVPVSAALNYTPSICAAFILRLDPTPCWERFKTLINKHRKKTSEADIHAYSNWKSWEGFKRFRKSWFTTQTTQSVSSDTSKPLFPLQ